MKIENISDSYLIKRYPLFEETYTINDYNKNIYNYQKAQQTYLKNRIKRKKRKK